jgi:hypothetical protein
MHYKRAETIGTTAPHPRSLDPASVGQVLRGGPADAHDIEAFWQANFASGCSQSSHVLRIAPQQSRNLEVTHLISSAFNREADSSIWRSTFGYWRRHLCWRCVLYIRRELVSAAIASLSATKRNSLVPLAQ